MTNPVPVLSDDALREIEARTAKATPAPLEARIGSGNNVCTALASNNPATFDDFVCDVLPDYACKPGIATRWEANREFIQHAYSDIPALCATVRALRFRLQNLESRWDANVAAARAAMEQSTALREQLVQRDQLLSDSNETEDRCRDLLAAYDQSSPEGVVSLDEVVRLAVGQLAHWQDRTRERTGEVEQLQAELAQVTQERDELRILTEGRFMPQQ